MAVIDRTRFRVYRGKEAQISHIPITDGYLYFATDTGNIYIDFQSQRKAMGGNGSGGGNTGLHYGNYPEIEPDVETELFTFLRSRLDDPDAVVSVDDIIINSDGAFFRVTAYTETNDLICSRIAVSGGGSGSGSASDTLDLSLTYSNIDKVGSTYIYKQQSKITFYPSAERDEEVSMVVTFHDNNNPDSEDIIYPFRVINGDPCEIDTSVLPISSNFTVSVLINSSSSRYNYGRGWTQVFEPIRIVEMGIEKLNAAAYLPVITSENLTGLSLSYKPIGGSSLASEKLHVYIDNSEVQSLSQNISAAQYGRAQTISIPSQSHGVHVVELSVSTVINNHVYESDRISFQAAWAEEGNDLPIVWIGDYDSTVIQYTNASIPYMVYNPTDVFNGRGSTVRFYLNGLQLSELDLSYNNLDWHYWDITDIYELGANLFTISSGAASAEVNITVTDVGARDLSVRYEKTNPQAILINLSAAGRSSNELPSVRGTWQNAGSRQAIQPILNGFNWANNGWIAPTPTSADYSNGSYLSLANGSSVTIPMPTVSLNNGSTDYTFEFRLRVRNIQKYSTLVTQIPTYFYDEYDAENDTWIEHRAKEDSITMDVIESDKNRYRVAIDEYGSPWSDEDHVIQQVNTSNGVILSWLNNSGEGFVIGTQEAFFKTPQKLVSVRYKEDEVFNLSFVISATEHLAYIYLNGIPSGATSLPMDGSQRPIPFVIAEQNITFNSDYADIDIYRIRMYGLGLSIPDVIHNYLADMHDLSLYDQNQLYEAGEEKELSYSRLIEYNEEHPDNPSMPYAIWKITTNDATGRETLPYYKGDSRKVDITFVNPVLDRALETGEISEWYYYTHSPSFFAKGVDINVQGTSSQGYPRRNYKTKYKKAKQWYFTKGPLAGRAMTQSWYFDNNTLKAIDPDTVDINTAVPPIKQNEGESDADYKVREKAYKAAVKAQEAVWKGQYKTLIKKFHMDAEKYATDKFTWKIDYMESSGSYNTGFANLLGNTVSPLYNKHPLDDYGIDTGTEMRTTVYGYPVLVFHEYADPNQMRYNLDMQNGVPSQRGDGQYEYIGRYNMNLDKSSNEYYGFEYDSEHPFVPGKTFAEVSECWEMKNNWGSWCSLRFPDDATRETGFGTQTDDKLSMVSQYEVRYNEKADQIESIIGEKLDYTSADVAAQAEFADEIGENRASHNHYLRQRFFHLEQLLYWIDSTDLTTITGGPIISYKPVMDEETKDVTIKKTYLDSVTYFTSVNYNKNQEDIPTYYYIDSNNVRHEKVNEGLTLDKITELGYTVITDDQGNPVVNPNVVEKTLGVRDEVNGCESVPVAGGGFNTTFEKDTRGYRIEKFRREFSKHFDLHYCLVYFVMTELCLCFDSRGKNMMLASYGPQEVGGDYIWYPIFYDIDTQLGLNNSGSYLWDYDADVTIDKIFSTATSVLWNNLYDIFYDNIVSMYRNLRGGEVSATNRQGGKLTYTNIIGAYECDPNVYDSYAMRGVRPIIAIGLDEYYKYFATTSTSGIGYFDTNGVHQYESTPTFAYCCQGDKKLTTELLLRNRLNYLDSQWLAGNYTASSVVIGGLDMRMTLNNAAKTSDKYLDISNEEIATNGLTGYVHGDYPVKYFDALPGVVIRPFLKQYITYFMDEVPVEPKKFNDTPEEQNGIRTNVIRDIETSYRNKTGLNDQIVKVPGTDYISSLGDLSTSYIVRMIFSGGKRLLDFKLGSDVPGYKNTAFDIDQFNFHGAADDSSHKPLLKQIILSQMSTFTKDINLSGSAKLEECRALGSKVSEVVFAPGAPLKIVHLPETVTSLELTQATELTKILTSKPVVGDWDAENWEFTYRDPATYTGLYIENVTDNVAAGQGHALNRLNVDGSGLQYNLYTLLNNLVTIKEGALNNNELKINLKQIDWTPYQQVPYGEAQGSGPYYRLNDHSMYDLYEENDATLWNELTLNGRIYTKDLTRDTSIITSLDLLDKFIADYQNTTTGINHFINTSGSVNKTYPTLAGQMFVENTAATAIDEFELTDKYGTIWPDLTIRAAYVNEAYLARFVQILDSGKEDEVDVIRYQPTSGATVTITSKVPAKQYYDFKGWALDKAGTTMVATYNEATHTCSIVRTLNFDNSTKEYTLYAIFENHPYSVNFYDVDGTTLLATTYSTYGQVAKAPNILPSTDESALANDETYKFKGYSRTIVPLAQATDRLIAESLVDLNTVNVTRDLTFYAMYKKQSVYDEPLSDDYFDFYQTSYNETSNTGKTEYNITTGYMLQLKDGKQVTGKVTLPNTHNDLPIITISGFAQQTQLTHLFFMDGGSNIRVFASSSFTGCSNLRWVEWPINTRAVELEAFKSCGLVLNTAWNNMHLYRMGESAFNQAFKSVEEGVEEVHFCGDFLYPARNGLAYLNIDVSKLDVVFGGPGDPSQLICDENNEERYRMFGTNGVITYRSYTLYVTGNRYDWWTANATGTSVQRWTWFLNQTGSNSYFNTNPTTNAVVINSAS